MILSSCRWLPLMVLIATASINYAHAEVPIALRDCSASVNTFLHKHNVVNDWRELVSTDVKIKRSPIPKLTNSLNFPHFVAAIR
jgi:hypothetical protein